MDKEFLMGNNDWLTRSIVGRDQSTSISPKLRHNLIMAAMKSSYGFYSGFFEISILNVDFDELAVKYKRDFSHAVSLGLFAAGGIREKDHLNLWCLSQAFSPELYVESGVFIGSSLHAFISSPSIKKIVAIDPNLNNLKLSKESIPGAELISNKDFSQIEINVSGMRSLVYFDDHIDTAKRVLQAYEKGFRYLLFDDSTGFEGICQRLYPAIPTIPMIMNAEVLSVGDQLCWTFKRPSSWLKGIAKRIAGRKGHLAQTKVTLAITQELVAKCLEAKEVIKQYGAIPDLGQFIPQRHPEQMLDTSKFLVELKHS